MKRGQLINWPHSFSLNSTSHLAFLSCSVVIMTTLGPPGVHYFLLKLWVRQGHKSFSLVLAMRRRNFHNISMLLPRTIKKKRKERKQISEGNKKQSQDIVLWFRHGFLVYTVLLCSRRTLRLTYHHGFLDWLFIIPLPIRHPVPGRTLHPPGRIDLSSPPYSGCQSRETQIFKRHSVTLLSVCFQVGRNCFVHKWLARQSGSNSPVRHNSLQIFWVEPLFCINSFPKATP